MRTNAPRTRSRTRVCKNQKISLHFSRASSPHPSAAKRKKKWKGNFWFCFAVSVSEKSNHILTFCLLFSPPSRRPRRFLSAFCGSSKPLWLLRRKYQLIKVEPRHTKFFKEWRDAKSICVCPTLPCAHNHPRRFGKNYKTAGMAPLFHDLTKFFEFRCRLFKQFSLYHYFRRVQICF